VAGLSLLTAGTLNAQSAGFKGNGVNHISLQVRDVDRSAEFYARVFGGTVQKTDKDARITLGRSRVILKRDTAAPKVDHFAIGVDKFNLDVVTADLKARGAVPLNNEAVGFHVLDPDGYPVQVSSND
jgi:catechol 2,3-dioxygenase-like lactoylglutathione lyase family enzyme